jgi:orotate phosphoribosyltransferase
MEIAYIDRAALWRYRPGLRHPTLGQGEMACQPEFVCGPLTGGAFVAQSLAEEMGSGFVFAERFVSEIGSVQYLIPESLREALRGGRVLLVDDVVNAGSALLSTLTDLRDCGS